MERRGPARYHGCVSNSQYLFGDSDIAARRLELLARVYMESTRAFLLKAAGGGPIGLALDLGCGPGFTTRLIADTVECDRAMGLDSSQSFVALAQRAHASNRVSFLVHDVTSIPFPAGKADLIFCRLLLTHLKEPESAAARWASQLERGGTLMLEETETIRTGHPVFARYLAIVDAMLAAQSNRLYIGAQVARFSLPGMTPIVNETRMVAVRNRDAAGMFAMNMGAWKDGGFIRSNYSHEEIAELERELRSIGADDESKREIVWEMRQSAWRRQSK